MTAVESAKGMEKEKLLRHQFGFFLHAYQPPREIMLPDGVKLEIVPFVNEEIYQECYRPVLVEGEGLPGAMTFSLYGTLREWIKRHHPEEFAKIKQKLTGQEGREHQVLGDPYLHPILPLLPEEDQETLVRIGRKAFKEDFGFAPKGFWLPETAVSFSTLRVLQRNGYKFVVLNENQLVSCKENPVYIHIEDGKAMAVFHFNPERSREVAFDESATLNGDVFLDRVNKENGHGLAIGVDFETFGHHKKRRDSFLKYVADNRTLSRYGFSPLKVKEGLSGQTRHYTEIKGGSSWSCDHKLGRWTGECCCDNPSEKARQEKRGFFQKLSRYQETINEKLDEINPLWRENFESVFLSVRNDLFNSEDVYHRLQALIPGERTRKLFLAKTFTFIGLTSCGWFFGADNNPEKEIPKTMISEIEKLV